MAGARGTCSSEPPKDIAVDEKDFDVSPSKPFSASRMTLMSLSTSGLMTAGIALAAAPPCAHASAARATNVLRAGGTLRPGDARTSRNGRYTLVMQRDGNLVLYRGRRPLWSAQTHGHRHAFTRLR